MDNPDTPFARHRNRQPRFRHGIHSRADKGILIRILRDTKGAGIDFIRDNLRLGRHEDHVVVRQSESRFFIKHRSLFYTFCVRCMFSTSASSSASPCNRSLPSSAGMNCCTRVLPLSTTKTLPFASTAIP